MWGKCTTVVAVSCVAFGIPRPVPAAEIPKEMKRPTTAIGYGRYRVCWGKTVVEKLGMKGKRLWAIPFSFNQDIDDGSGFGVEGGLVTLPGGDLLAFRYNDSWDSGADLIRFDPLTGSVRWRASCARMGAYDSEEGDNGYAVYIKVRGDLVRVTCDGSGGNFVETLNLASGQRVKRRQRLVSATW